MKCPTCNQKMIEAKTLIGCRQCKKVYQKSELEFKDAQEFKLQPIIDSNISTTPEKITEKNIVKQIETELFIKSSYRKSSIDLESYDEESDYKPSFEDD